MKLFTYYALHTFKNQLKKLFKTWVLIFIIACFVLGGVIGLLVASVEEAVDENASEDTQIEIVEEEEETFWDATGIEPNDLIELIVGGVILAVFVFFAYSADTNGSKIFLPADVNLLFASPMKPQSVLMFRLTTKLGAAILGSIYLLFQIPNLTLNVGLSIWAALAIMAVWCFTIILATLIQVLLYVLSSTYPAVKQFLHKGIYALLVIIIAGYLFVLKQSGDGYMGAAAAFFNAKGSRYIPVWGWLKGFCMYAVEGNSVGVALCFAAIVLGSGLLIWFIWRIKADFYEDAMAKSEETAELLAKAQSEKSSGVLIKRKKDRSDKLRRDGMRHGSGANVFFFKTMYNRFRFAHMGFFTKTMEFYLVASVGVASICRFAVGTSNFIPVALTLAGLSFFRSLGNPLAQDTSMDYFVMIPESGWAKLFWSLMGGTVNCLLDVLPAVIIGAVLVGANPLLALVWIPFIISVDFYATNVGAFIDLSVPVSAGKMIKQIVQVMFVYFGLLPDIAVIAIGFALGHTAMAIVGAAIINIGLGFLFFGLTPLFIDPRGGKRRQTAAPFSGDLHAAKKQFSRLGIGVFVILAVASALQIAAGIIVGNLYPTGGEPAWLIWLYTFAPMYAVAVPLGILILRKAPATPREEHDLAIGQIITTAIICIFMMYAGNIIGTVVTSLLQGLLGLTAVNPLLSYAMDDNVWIKILVMVILAPVIEEYIFRKQMIDRMNVYGEKLAVVTSALIFGLFHGNLSQLFYAFGLGLVFGYIYLKTGKLRYSAGLHMFVNFMGSVAGPWLLSNIGLDTLEALEMADSTGLTALFSPQLFMFFAYVLVMIVLAVVGLVLLCIKSRDVSFAPTELALPKGLRFKTVYMNVGMILLIAGCLASIVLMILI